MDKQLEEYILDWIELEAYRTLEGVPFDFGTGLIKNDLSFGTEEAYWEMEQQDLEEIINNCGHEKQESKKKKYRLNHYKRKRIDRIKKEKLAKISWFPVWYDEDKKQYRHLYLSGCRKYAKRQTNKIIRNTNNFQLKGSGYRKTFDYWNTLF